MSSEGVVQHLEEDSRELKKVTEERHMVGTENTVEKYERELNGIIKEPS